jgi:hypothetical protein
MENRKAFNFYRSYFDVAKELSGEDRATFLWAILVKQFEDKDTELNGMAKFAYLSQFHSIKSQVEGYKSNPTGAKTKGGKQGGSVGGKQGGSVQEEEKGKVEEKEQEKIYTQRQPKLDINGYVIIEEDESKS